MAGLLSVPGLGGYLQAGQLDQQQQMGQLAQAQGLIGILSAVQQQQQRAQALQEQQQLKGVLSQSGGDPARAVQALLQAGTPQAVELASKLKGLMPKPAEPYTLGPDQVRFGPNGQPVAFGLPKIEPLKANPTRHRPVQVGNAYFDVTEEMKPNGSWAEIGRKPVRDPTIVMPRQPQMVTTPDGVFQVGPDGNARPVVGPDGRPLAGRGTEKALPTSAAQKLFENQANQRRAEQALALVEGGDVGPMKGAVNATGIKGFLPDVMLQRIDPAGVDARAALADLGSLVIHDRSGAAVTAAEFPRLRPFIPQVTDDQATVAKKLRRFAQVYRDISEDTKNFYRESGYKVPDSITAPAAEQPGGATGGWSIRPR